MNGRHYLRKHLCFTSCLVRDWAYDLEWVHLQMLINFNRQARAPLYRTICTRPHTKTHPIHTYLLPYLFRLEPQTTISPNFAPAFSPAFPSLEFNGLLLSLSSGMRFDNQLDSLPVLEKFTGKCAEVLVKNCPHTTH